MPRVYLYIEVDSLSYSFNKHLFHTYSVTGTALLETATHKDQERRELRIQEQFTFSSGLKTKSPPHTGQVTSSINKLH